MLYRIRRRLQALQPKLNVELFYYHSLNEINKMECRVPIKIQTLNKKDLYRLNEVKRLNINRLLERHNRGDMCYVAIVNDSKIASYHWVQEIGSHYIQQAGRFEEVRNNEAWIYHVRVAENYRGNRINGAVYQRILTDCKERGIKKVWVYTNLLNNQNRKGLEKLGFVLDYKIYSLYFKNKYYQLYKKKLPYA